MATKSEPEPTGKVDRSHKRPYTPPRIVEEEVFERRVLMNCAKANAHAHPQCAGGLNVS